MKLVKSLILGSAAALSRGRRSTGGRSSRQGQSGRVREGLLLYGPGFYYIPGTDTCIKLGGYLRARRRRQRATALHGPNFNGAERCQQPLHQRLHLAFA